MTNLGLMRPNLKERKTLGAIEEEEIESKNFEALNFVDGVERGREEELDAFELEFAPLKLKVFSFLGKVTAVA